ncbi:HIT family protein [Paenibacillus sp. JDR-2]|uniref:HIT family protein n=1 Tax=Paenibacillus sp. (strain JDR-2) TaxID=324057 RepID=UPI0001663DB6|nr:HIT family protein [Paenibacillus sp. JDR-2]ACT02567.1 histidine triad (HIT) protein [Paenibacillus sp. JDR-2]
MNCLGCRIASGMEPDLNIVYENEYLTCVLDIVPFNEGHLLILPKQHYLDVEELDSETAQAIMAASQKLSIVLKKIFCPDGISICQNGGLFNDLTHYHMHLIPRYKGDGFSWSEPATPHGAELRLRETRERMVRGLTAHVQKSPFTS